MALADTRIAYQPDVDKHAGALAYELVQGNLVQWNSFMDKSIPDPPTVVLYGILGSRKNWGYFAQRLAQEFPMWQFLLVDLRCHGDSASIKKHGPHTVASTALDALKLGKFFSAGTEGKLLTMIIDSSHTDTQTQSGSSTQEGSTAPAAQQQQQDCKMYRGVHPLLVTRSAHAVKRNAESSQAHKTLKL
ncbi:uncharacterized protein C2845_PM14G14730 [Panicum miliaceum]|uniref:AB hydrolase-1 domain-containing protein n=1 Tax=Panicum miliaceum TaxID=4540 RepID=A0A3L6PMZ3_PANMI|nr:uncharacterized protein C2845_PM14G14730 [Panicum miliaceum]